MIPVGSVGAFIGLPFQVGRTIFVEGHPAYQPMNIRTYDNHVGLL
jgi:hypothetical protein